MRKCLWVCTRYSSWLIKLSLYVFLQLITFWLSRPQHTRQDKRSCCILQLTLFMWHVTVLCRLDCRASQEIQASSFWWYPTSWAFVCGHQLLINSATVVEGFSSVRYNPPPSNAMSSAAFVMSIHDYPYSHGSETVTNDALWQILYVQVHAQIFLCRR